MPRARDRRTWRRDRAWLFLLMRVLPVVVTSREREDSPRAGPTIEGWDPRWLPEGNRTRLPAPPHAQRTPPVTSAAPATPRCAAVCVRPLPRRALTCYGGTRDLSARRNGAGGLGHRRLGPHLPRVEIRSSP